MGEPTYHEPTFRTWPPEDEVVEMGGREYRLRLCEEQVDGRWEPFYTLREC